MDREGLDLRTGWRRPVFVPFDEVVSVGEGRVTLTSGRVHALTADLCDRATRAIAPPAPTGRRAEDAAALQRWIAGDWSPVRATQALLALATSFGASDLHLEAEPDGYGVRMRVSGDLLDLLHLDTPTGTRLVAAFKHVSGCLPYRSDTVQEGRIPRAGVTADVRTSFLPTALGERAAIRLFGRLLDLADLGFSEEIRRDLASVLDRPSGLFLVAGPSGGGKTTTLYAALAWLARHRGGAHLSLEDPVEQRLRVAGIPVDQVELKPERGLTAEVALVGALRQDVDVLAVGEIRTPAEASLALQAAHTGRMVLAGVHAGSASETRQRMLDLGVDARVLETTLLAVLHQRLQAVPCPSCEGVDCTRCHGAGRIRVPVADLYLPGGTP